jgi:hypothetical protein
METMERPAVETQQQDSPSMQSEPRKEHAWLRRMVGQWTYESECLMGPDQPPMKSSGTETVRAIGDTWIVSEGTAVMPDGSPGTVVITLGFDPQKGRFVGTFFGSMMTELWVYDGWLDADERILTLEADGQSFTDPSATAKYRDIVELVSDDYRILRSLVLGGDGQWVEFMTMHSRRA